MRLPAVSELVERTLPFPPWVFGVGVFAVLMLLLAVTFAFRNVGSRH